MLACIAAFFAALASCRTRSSPPSAPAESPVLSGAIHFTAPQSGKGRVVAGWLSPAEATAWHEGRVEARTFRALLERFRVGDEIDLAEGGVYRVDAPSDASPLVIVDVGRSFWPTLLGGGDGFMGLGRPGGGSVIVGINPKRPSSLERCFGERMQLVVVHAPEVAGAVGNPVDRRFCAYLPPSYPTAPSRRYPVVFLFGGFMSDEMVRFSGKPHAGDVADAFAKETGREAILVGVDASTKTGSSYLEDSPVTGKWASFMSGAVLAIDAKLRTIGTREARGIVGQSTGGFLAVSFGMRHTELFSAIGATAPDALDLSAWLFDRKDHVKPWLVAWARLEASLGGPGQMNSYAADWSPEPDGRLVFPFDLKTGTPNGVLARWMARSPSRWLDDPAFAMRVRETLGGKILLAVSARDEFDLTEPARAFSEKLKAVSVPHELEITPEGHLEGGAARTERALRFVISKLAAASP